ncbi:MULTISPECIES: DNA methyltransferase [Cobetia]|uniref:DNA methyltransferase n=1 Tax=Cobetia TaxID=204286 RepID=UPI0015842BA6|nr:MULTISPECIES: DNA methyltransferase [Cobetia]MDI4659574.1 site-specific DNA-methyltransferase [Cobetia sp. BMC6]NUJ56123.1 site-specific DNA-methyltransferase [Cobetia marina]
MEYSNQFFKALGVSSESRKEVKDLSKLTGISVSRLGYYNSKNILPSGKDLSIIQEVLGISELELSLKMGRLNQKCIGMIQEYSDSILKLIGDIDTNQLENKSVDPVFETELGSLYREDCLDYLKSIDSDSVDLIFADPPFNLDKMYPSDMNDNLKEEEYLKWTESWMNECIRVLKHGGSFFVWNLPAWNGKFSNFLNGRLNFKHWIAVDMKYSLPIKGRLYPSHYSLLYFVKGEKPNKLSADRLPTPTCPSCFGDIKDYGGYKHKMNPKGISLTDVWTDIPPVRHAKYKKRTGANELSVKLMDRIIEMSTDEGNLVLDPFGGSGTTFIVAELKGRRWTGCEIGPCEEIVERFRNQHEDAENLKNIRSNLNHLFTPTVRVKREARGLWTAESVAKKKEKEQKAHTSREFTLFD